MLHPARFPAVAILLAILLTAAMPGPAARAGLAPLARAAALMEEAGRIMARQRQRACLAMALYHEARGEPLEGQIAVAATIINRVASRAYPATICGVVFQNAEKRNACQFSFACDGRPLRPRNGAAFRRMAMLAGRIMASLDAAAHPRPGADALIAAVFRRLAFATHYHRHDVHPAWSRRLERIARIGAHVFFRSERVIRRMPAHVRLARVLMRAGARG